MSKGIVVNMNMFFSDLSGWVNSKSAKQQPPKLFNVRQEHCILYEVGFWRQPYFFCHCFGAHRTQIHQKLFCYKIQILAHVM